MTTSFLDALTEDQLTILRGDNDLAARFIGRVRVSTCPNEIIFAAQINQTVFANSIAQITYDNVTIGAYTDLIDGMTVFVSPVNDIKKAIFTGRIRENGAGSIATSTIVYINENSAALANNYYIFVTDDYRIADRLGREVSGVLKMDYDRPFRQLRPLVYNLKSVYVGDVDPDTGEITFDFAPLALAATSGNAVVSWLWDIGDGTYDVGSNSTQNITATFPEGFRWVHLVVHDDDGLATTRHIQVHAHGDTYAPALMTADGIQVTVDVATGYDATMTAFDGVNSLLDNTAVVIWSDDTYQDGSGAVTGDNILFTGRIRKSTAAVRNSEQGVDSQINFTLESPLTQLARLEQLPYEMLNKANPTAWGQVKNLTIWRGIVLMLSECSTFLELHDLTFDSISDTFLAPTHNMGSSILDSMNDLAVSVNAALQMNSSGQAEIVRDAVMLESAERDALITVAEWTDSDLFEIQGFEREHVRTVGRLKAEGGSYSSASDLFTGFRAIAPGVAQESGQGSETLDKQILAANQSESDAKLELRKRAGHALERAQKPDEMTLVFMDGYQGVLIPSRNMWHTFTLAATETFPGLTSGERWLLVNVQIVHSGDGTKQVTAKFVAETMGTPGQDTTPPLQTGTPAPMPLTPPFQYDPVFGGGLDFFLPPFAPINPIIQPDTAPRTDGNSIATATADELWLVSNFVVGAVPNYRSIHPEPGATVRAFLWYPWSVNNKGALALVGDDSTTVLYRTVNGFAKPPLWIAGQAMDGVYTRLRAEATKGKLYIAGDDIADVDLGSIWSILSPAHGANLTTGTDGTGAYVQIDAVETDPIGFPGLYYAIIITGGDNICCDWFGTGDENGNPLVADKYVNWCGEAVNTASPHPYLGIPQARMCEAVKTSAFTVRFYFESCSDAVASSFSAYSEDYGGTFATPKDIADALLSGFDTEKKGTQVLAGTGIQARKASAGGIYSDYGGTKEQGALHIPRFNFGSITSSNSGSTPQYLLASNVVNGDDEALWKVTASGATFTDITPTVSGDIGFASGPECLTTPWFNGNIIVAIMMFGSLPRLVVSKNGGSTWAHSNFLNENANYVRMRKNDPARKQAFFNSMSPSYCANIQAATPVVFSRAYPGDTPIILIEPFGG